MRSPKQLLFGSLGAALAVSGLSALQATPAQANPAGTGVIISEVYGAAQLPPASYGNDFIELYNPTASDVDLTGWSVQYRSAAGNTAQVTALTGEIPAHGHYLVQEGNFATGNQLPNPDAKGGIGLSGTNGVVLLVNNTTAYTTQGDLAGAASPLVDMVGYGTTPTSFETANTGVALTNVTSAQRNVAAAQPDSDNNATDFSELAPTPVNAAGETEPTLAAVAPTNLTVVVNEPLTSFDLSAVNGVAPYAWSATGLPAGVSVSPTGTVSGTPTETGTFPVTLTVTDSDTPADTDEATFTITVNAEPPPLKEIADVQGTGSASPEVGNTLRVRGVVTAMYKDPAFTGSDFDGMYVQTAGTGGAVDATAGSDALFVYGSSSMPAGVVIGDSVEVTGIVSEFQGITEITPGAGGVVELDPPLAAVTPLAIAYPTTESGREAQEGMLLAPTDQFTVTNVYDINSDGEIGLATGDAPLRQPTEFFSDSSLKLDEVKADNAARSVVLDDGTSVYYMANNTVKGQPLPWLSPANPIRVGAEATLTGPVVLEFRDNVWRFQPQAPVYDAGAGTATFENTRPQNAAPANVGGDLKIATFNVLNYFNTTGEDYVTKGASLNPKTHCTYYTDRDGNRIANNRCGFETPNGPDPNDGRGPRGAATAASLARQQAKIVTAINLLDADIVGLQEVENSVKLVNEIDRDDALRSLVDALNAAAGSEVWRYVHSPGEATLTTPVAEQDVIRPAFIYRAASVEPVGQSDILFGTTEFANAREPLAQAFKAKGALDSDAFAVVLNHFKSKGDSTPAATGDNANSVDTGAFNGDRTRQAHRLVQFADEFAQARGTDAVFLAGDFNSYSKEDPIRVLEQGGFGLIDSDDPTEESYSFSGLSGSLDHVLGNSAARDMVTGADIWDINAAESVAFQYSRYNYNVTQFFNAADPFAASDHNPEIVGIDVPDVTGSYKRIQVVGTNDFHGRILPSGGDSAGAEVLSGALDELRADNPNTVFVAAGDLVGASTFESFIQNDQPTIDALNAAGLEVSAAGNHEFDQGYEDFVGRIQDEADWEYIAANVNEPAGRDDLAETWTKTIDGVQVGFVGAVTEDLPSLVSPAGIEGVTVSDIVDSTNAAAAQLKAQGADLVVLLVHEGSPTTDCASPNFTDANTVWGNITQNTSADVDAIVSGHTHLAYNCSYPVASWANEGRAVTKRPVVSAGQYGQNLNQLVFTYDDNTGDLVAVSQEVIGIAGTGYEKDPALQQPIADAVAQAEVLGAVKLGEIEGPFNRAKLQNGTTENRGGESTIGNLVAEVQRWATDTPETGSAEIAFMNPGGLRQDMGGTVNGDVRDLTYKQAAVVQPFANTLVNMQLTGAQIETVLEQQWQRTTAGAVPSRPFLRLGVSAGFTYTYTETPVTVNGTATFQGEVTGMWLDGVAVDAARSYSVTVNSFLASGGDNFFELAKGASKKDTGKVDLQAMVDYMDEHASTDPLPVDYSQHAVEVEFPGDAPASYAPGGHVKLAVGSWAMSGTDLEDAELQVKLGDQVLGTAPVDNTIGTAVYDPYGTAAVDVVLPASTPGGVVTLTLVGAQTGTEVRVPIAVTGGVVTPPAGQQAVTLTVTTKPKKVVAGKTRAKVLVTVVDAAGKPVTGTITVKAKGQKARTVTVVDGKATVKLKVFPTPGKKKVVVTYPATATHLAATATTRIRVVRR